MLNNKKYTLLRLIRNNIWISNLVTILKISLPLMNNPNQHVFYLLIKFLIDLKVIKLVILIYNRKQT